MKRAIQFRPAWLAWPAAAALLWLALRDIPLTEMGKALSGLKPVAIGLLILLNAGVLALFALRWWIILRAFGARVKWSNILAYRLAGFGVSYFTPGPQFGGEPLQVMLLHRRDGVSTHNAVSSVFFDKLLELLANFTFLVIGLATALMGGLLGGGIPTWGWATLAALFLFPALHLLALARGKTPLTAAVRRLRRGRTGRLETAEAHALHGETQIAEFLRTRPRALWAVLAVSSLVWLVSVAEFTLLLRFLGLEVSIPTAVAILTAVRIAFLLPSPAGLGTLEAALVLASRAAGFDPASGAAAGLVIRARDFTLGAVGIWLGVWLMRPAPAPTGSTSLADQAGD